MMKNKDKIILDLCGGSGSWSAPYADAGYDVRLITLPDHDIMTFVPPKNVYGILCAPPCNEFSTVKTHTIERDIKAGLKLVNRCLVIKSTCHIFSNLKFWALENPSGKLAQYIGKPVYSFQPYWFGDAWTKRTMLWGDFNKPVRLYQKYEELEPLKGAYIRPTRKTVTIAFNHFGHMKYFPSLEPYIEYCSKFPTSATRDSAFRSVTSPAFAKAFFEWNR